MQRPAETPRWNFHKYLVGRDGTLAAAFASAVEPTDTRRDRSDRAAIAARMTAQGAVAAISPRCPEIGQIPAND